MDHPDQLFSRIRRQKARPALLRQGQNGVAPAPMRATVPARASVPSQPPAAPPNPPQPAVADEPPGSPPAPPRPVRGHTLYSQLMRSHDRMGTRHL